MHAIGTKVIVTTCSGQYRGIVRGHAPFGYQDKEATAYQVSGPSIQTTTKKVTIDDGRTLKTGPTCNTCENREGCCFEAKTSC